jgi:hypothetical protein
VHTRSNIAVALGTTTSPEEWDALVAGNGGCFFQRHHWLTTMAEVLGLDFHGLTVHADGQPVGVAPMLLKRIGPVRTVNWVPFPYVGPLVPAALLPHVLPLLSTWERRNRAIRSQHVFMSTVDQVPTEDRTFVVDFGGETEDSLLQRVEPKRRAKIRRAAARAVVRPSTHD